MKRGGYLKRYTKLESRSKNPDRRRRQRKRHRELMGEDGIAPFIRGLPCACCGAEPPSQVAHIRTRGAGQGPVDDQGRHNLIPLNWSCHWVQHSIGWRHFVRQTGLRARRTARAVAEFWDQLTG